MELTNQSVFSNIIYLILEWQTESNTFYGNILYMLCLKGVKRFIFQMETLKYMSKIELYTHKKKTVEKKETRLSYAHIHIHIKFVVGHNYLENEIDYNTVSIRHIYDSQTFRGDYFCVLFSMLLLPISLFFPTSTEHLRFFIVIFRFCFCFCFYTHLLNKIQLNLNEKKRENT